MATRPLRRRLVSLVLGGALIIAAIWGAVAILETSKPALIARPVKSVKFVHVHPPSRSTGFRRRDEFVIEHRDDVARIVAMTNGADLDKAGKPAPASCRVSDTYGLRFTFANGKPAKIDFDPIKRCGAALYGPLGGENLDELISGIQQIAESGPYLTSGPAVSG